VLNVALEVPQRATLGELNTLHPVDAPQPEIHDPRLTPGQCEACCPLVSLETGYYQNNPNAPPPKSLEERKRDRDARNSYYFRGSRAASPTDMEGLIQTLTGIPRAPATNGAPRFAKTKRRPETEQPRLQCENEGPSTNDTLYAVFFLSESKGGVATCGNFVVLCVLG
jgi:hypothetical protein